jgi:hypothetical protein
MDTGVELIEIKNNIDNEIKLREDNLNKYIVKTKFYNLINQIKEENKQKISVNITSYDDSNILRYLSNRYPSSTNYVVNILENDFNLEFNKSLKDYKSIINFMRYIFARYHNKIGGNLFEDDWVMYKYEKNQTKYELNKNEIIFDNSINTVYRKDINTINYIKRLQDLFQKVTKDSNYKISLKMIEDEKHNIIVVAFMLKPRK